jgi:hypothetical protein
MKRRTLTGFLLQDQAMPRLKSVIPNNELIQDATALEMRIAGRTGLLHQGKQEPRPLQR